MAPSMVPANGIERVDGNTSTCGGPIPRSIWDSEVIDADGFGALSLAIDANDDLFLSYGAPSGTLRYAHSDGATWVIEA